MIVLGVPVLSRYDLLERLLASAEARTVKPDRYLIVDNGRQLDVLSPGISRAVERGATVSVLSPGRNLGVAASWNAILSEAHTESVIVANDDVTLGPETIARLSAATGDLIIAEGPPNANGWCLFVQSPRCTALVGPYDEHFYPAYYEDSDYRRRLALAGIAPVRVPSDHAHEGWATLRQESADGPIHQGQRRSLDYYQRKWGGPPDAERFTQPFDGQPVEPTPQATDAVWMTVRRSGPLMRYDVVNRILETIGSRRYLEVGVSTGEMMRRIHADHRVGVDPAPTDTARAAATEFFATTSDAYFAEQSPSEFDVAFIDGLHHADQAYRDIENACRRSKVVVVHDSNPSTEAMQVVPAIQSEWTGDVWRAIARIRAEGKHTVRTIDTDYGVAVVLPNRGEVVPTLPRETWADLVQHRATLLGLLSPEEWEDWFDAQGVSGNRHQRRTAHAKKKKLKSPQDNQQPRICLNMIVKNERAIIERCLAAALPFIDTWVIADTGSTDGTGEAIERFFADRKIPGKLVRTTFENFAQARNVALDAARAVGGWDYALLLDADMVLQGSLDRQALTGPAYKLLQRAGTLDYWNTRLVKRTVPAHYVGVTHEFLSVEGSPNLEGLTIDDRNDGGSKGDKGERDIRLLNEGLAAEPQNERYMFYLANTYREMGRHPEAIQWYRRRIAAGGWDEEVWASYYGIARSYSSLDNEPAFVLACFDAYNYRPSRAESLSLLARWWREHGKNDAAILIAEEVARIPLPGDILFIDRDVYERRNEADVAISGFYSKVPERRQAGYDACARLTIDRDARLRNEARGNFVHYVKSAGELFGAKVQPIDWKPDDGYAPMNPSVLIAPNGRRLCLVRTVNYTVATGQYPTIDGSNIIRTRNHVVEMDESWRPVATHPLTDATGLPRTSYPVEGFEDCRLWTDGDQLCASATVRDLGDGRCEMAILAIDSEWRITGARVVRDYEPDRAQKNWMPILGAPGRFLYLCDPTTVIDCAPEGTIERSRVTDIDANLTELRGGSQVIPHRDGWLCLVHEVFFTPERVYLHRLVRLNEKFEIDRVTEPFFFQNKGIEFVAGLAQDGDRFVASFGVNDASAHLAFFDAAAVDRALR